MSTDRDRALESYRLLAPDYDRTCGHIRGIRAAAIDRLALEPGQTVFDVACGTGDTLVELAYRVGAAGRVVGIEQCPEMASVARRKIAAQRLDPIVSLIVSPVEDARLEGEADALLFCYTHDVLQTPAALANLFSHAKAGACVAAAGARLMPWGWGWPLNLYTLWRGRRYLTTFRGLSSPWSPLRAYCPDLAPVRLYHLGTGYLAAGRAHSGPALIPAERGGHEPRLQKGDAVE